MSKRLLFLVLVQLAAGNVEALRINMVPDLSDDEAGGGAVGGGLRTARAAFCSFFSLMMVAINLRAFTPDSRCFCCFSRFSCAVAGVPLREDDRVTALRLAGLLLPLPEAARCAEAIGEHARGREDTTCR